MGASPHVINGVRLSGTLKLNIGEPDSSKIVTVHANNGKTGEHMDLSYTNYKVIGNGSFVSLLSAFNTNISLYVYINYIFIYLLNIF